MSSRRILRLCAAATLAVVPCASALAAQQSRGVDLALSPPSFLEGQLAFPRVYNARDEKQPVLRERFSELGLRYPPAGLYLRVFKAERTLQVWVRPQDGERYRLLNEYPICDVSGALGPKRAAGDRQIPEGFYDIESFNPQSEFYLSLRVNYPNDADRLMGRGRWLGGDIYIHGGCSTIGCVPLTDDTMKEIYWLAVEARANGARRIPVHIFPTRMDEIGSEWLHGLAAENSQLHDFWDQLREGYEYFEEHHTLPFIITSGGGRYVFAYSEHPDGVAPPMENASLLGTPVSGEQGAAVEATGLLGSPASPEGGTMADASRAPAAEPASEEGLAETETPLVGRPAAGEETPLAGWSADEAEAGLMGRPVDEEETPPGADTSAAVVVSDGAEDGILGRPLEPAPASGAAAADAPLGEEEEPRYPSERGSEGERVTILRAGILGEPLLLGAEVPGAAERRVVAIPGYEPRFSEDAPRMPVRPPRTPVLRPAL